MSELSPTNRTQWKGLCYQLSEGLSKSPARPSWNCPSPCMERGGLGDSRHPLLGKSTGSKAPLPSDLACSRDVIGGTGVGKGDKSILQLPHPDFRDSRSDQHLPFAYCSTISLANLPVVLTAIHDIVQI